MYLKSKAPGDFLHPSVLAAKHAYPFPCKVRASSKADEKESKTQHSFK